MGDNVHVNGDLEEATFGNVVRFSCKFNNEILFGPQEIYCDENGEWSGQAPQCKGAVKYAVQNKKQEAQEGLLLGKKKDEEKGKKGKA